MVEPAGPGRACDRCHAIKERCRWMHGRDKCERCQRLHSLCQTQRPLKPRGRKSRYALPVAVGSPVPILPHRERTSTNSSNGPDVTPVASIIARSKHYKIPRTLSVFVDLNERERQILDGIPHGRTPVDQYLVAPSFTEHHIKSFVRLFDDALPFLRDALLASSALIAHEHHPRPVQLDRIIGHKRAASAISSLRSLQSFDTTCVAIILSLGILAVCFVDLISGHSLEICRHCLHLVKPLCESSVPLDADSICFVGCLINSELDECLFRCEAPTLRYRVQGSVPMVDRFLGISTPLLPYMHDIAVISHRLCHDAGADRTQIMETLDALETEVGQWRPELPKSYGADLPRKEILSILTQANVTRLSILLIAHRLRHPYGTETTKAGAISRTILDELSLTVEYTGRSFPSASRAFLVACFELTGPEERKSNLEKTPLFAKHSKQVQRNVKAMLVAAWKFLDNRDQLCWHDLCNLFPW